MMTMKPYRYLVALGLAMPLMAAPALQMVTIKRVAANQATIKTPLNAGEQSEIMRFQGGPGSKTPDQIHYKEITLRMLIKRAYKLKYYQISGPAWIDTERYDVDAQLPAGTNWEQLLGMLQALLTERFQLRAHSSATTVMGYRLTVADGGAKLLPPEKSPAKKDTQQMMEENRKRLEEMQAAMKREPGRSMASRGFWSASATTERLAETLSSQMNAPVRNDTKIEGLHAYRVDWVPEDPNALSGPNLFMAVEEQLGLKLQGEQQQVQVLVIDHAAMDPVGN